MATPPSSLSKCCGAPRVLLGRSGDVCWLRAQVLIARPHIKKATCGSAELGSYRHHLWSFLASQTNRINGMQGLVGDRTSEKVACGNTEGHLDVYHLYCGPKPCWRLGPAAAGSHIDVSSLCDHLRPGECPCSRLPPKGRPCLGLWSYGIWWPCLWSLLSPETMRKPMI